MPSSDHRHTAATERTVGYTGTVPSPINGENRAAHGSVCHVETCSCGAERRTNSNGMHAEVGAWVQPLPDRAGWRLVLVTEREAQFLMGAPARIGGWVAVDEATRLVLEREGERRHLAWLPPAFAEGRPVDPAFARMIAARLESSALDENRNPRRAAQIREALAAQGAR